MSFQLQFLRCYRRIHLRRTSDNNTPILYLTILVYFLDYQFYSQVTKFEGNFMNTYTQRRVQLDQRYFTVQITENNFECSL